MNNSIWADDFDDYDDDSADSGGISGRSGISITSAGPRVTSRHSTEILNSIRCRPMRTLIRF
jgi:hypothetical protein